MDDLTFWKLARNAPAEAADFGEAHEIVAIRQATTVFPDFVVRAIRLDERPYEEIAADYGMPAATVSKIKTRRLCRDVEGEIRPSRRARKGTLTPGQVRAIYRAKGRALDVAEAHGTTPAMVAAIRARTAYHADTTPEALAADPEPANWLTPEAMEEIREAVRVLAARYNVQPQQVALAAVHLGY